MKHFSRGACVALIVFFCFSLGENAAAFQDIDSEILAEMAANNIPSLAACILKDEAVVWEKAYGLSNVEGNLEATTDTIYLLASVSKLVVVTAVMQLVEQNMIDLDAHINLYLPFELRNPHHADRKITIRMLLTHSSSLTGPQTDDELPEFYDWYLPDGQPELEETITDYLIPGGMFFVPELWTEAVPGQRELYSNLGVTLLGYIVEFVSGRPFYAYCRDFIFLPLDMLDTSFRMCDLNPAKVATRYGDTFTPLMHYSRRDFPAGQLKSSVRDFSHFLIAYINRGRYGSARILEEKTVDEVLKIHNPASGLCLLWNCTIGGWFGHEGGVIGGSTYVEFQREDKVGLIIFSNTFLRKGNPIYPPQGKIYGLLRKKANAYRPEASDRTGFRSADSKTSRFRKKK